MTALSPIVTPGRTVTLAPIQTLRYRVVSDESVVAQDDATLILKPASGVDEDPSAQGDVLSEVRGERREHSDGIVHRFACQLGQQLPNPVWIVVFAVELGGDPQGFLADLVHHAVQGGVAGDGLAGVECVEKVVEVHDFCHLPGYRAPVQREGGGRDKPDVAIAWEAGPEHDNCQGLHCGRTRRAHEWGRQPAGRETAEPRMEDSVPAYAQLIIPGAITPGHRGLLKGGSLLPLFA
jgi:hypothetical protein